MTKTAAAARGRVLSSAFHEPAASRLVTETGQAGMALFMTLILVMYGQSFQYVVDVMPLYALSKVWPILMAPLAILGLARLQMPGRTLFLLCFLWLFIVTPTISTLQLGNSPLAAAATTVKVWSLGYVFGLGAMLFWLRPSEKLLGNIVLGLGATTFVVMTLLFVLAPEAAFEQSAEETKIFLWDIERGRRIYAPMFFALFTVFMLNRSFWLKPQVWKVLAIAASLVITAVVYKQRVSLAAACLVVMIGAVLSLPRGKTLVIILLSAIAIAGGFVVANLVQETFAKGLGGSLSVRQMEGFAALTYLNSAPWRWITGVGSITRSVGGINALAQIVGARVFFLHDLGWLGVTFEYGAIGVTLILLVHGVCAYITGRNLGQRSALQRACFDYVLYILITSPVYAITFAPGEVMTCTAIGFYLWHERRRASTKAAEPPKKLEAAPLQARRRPQLPSVVS
jgi:hypothetical protein